MKKSKRIIAILLVVIMLLSCLPISSVAVSGNVPADIIAMSSQVAVELEQEGIVLLENEDNVLPIGNKKVNIFGAGSVVPFLGGAGSGAITTEDPVTFYEALDENNINYNKELRELYETECSGNETPKTGNTVINNLLQLVLAGNSLEEMPCDKLTDDIMQNRKFLEKQIGKIVRGFAYPSISAYNDISEMALKATDIVYARLADNPKTFSLPENWLRWMPTCHHNLAPELFEKFKGEVPHLAPMLMYVWGHSYEFDRQNNWELIEGLLEECSKTTDIWYATNMEIYNYVNAFKQLVFSADGSFVHNPTAISLWGILDANKKTGAGKIVKIAPGETIELHL